MNTVHGTCFPITNITLLYSSSCITNAIEENDKSNYFSVYPNPTELGFSIKMADNYHEIYTLELFNSIGERVFFNKNLDFISLEFLPLGVYFLKISTKSDIFTSKIIKN